MGSAATLQKDGKLVAVGYATVPPTQFAVARFNRDGSLDATFSDDGKVITSMTVSNSYAEGVVVQPDGKIVLAGCATIGSAADFALVRLNSDGSLDATFNGGYVTTAVGLSSDTAFAAAIQCNGKTVWREICGALQGKTSRRSDTRAVGCPLPKSSSNRWRD